jgi:hypothetical protein
VEYRSFREQRHETRKRAEDPHPLSLQRLTAAEAARRAGQPGIPPPPADYHGADLESEDELEPHFSSHEEEEQEEQRQIHESEPDERRRDDLPTLDLD